MSFFEEFTKHFSQFDGKAQKEIIRDRRRSGTSTAQALKLISDAMSNPSTDIKIIDVVFVKGKKTKQSGPALLRQTQFLMIPTIIQKLKLEGFSFNKLNGTLRYDVPWLKVKKGSR